MYLHFTFAVIVILLCINMTLAFWIQSHPVRRQDKMDKCFKKAGALRPERNCSQLTSCILASHKLSWGGLGGEVSNRFYYPASDMYMYRVMIICALCGSGECRSGLSNTDCQMIKPHTHTLSNSRRAVRSCSERMRLLSEVIVISISHSNSWLQRLEAQSRSYHSIKALVLHTW